MRFAAGLSEFVTSCGQKLWQWIKRKTLTARVVAVLTLLIALFGALVGVRQWKAIVEADRPWVASTAVSAGPIAPDTDGIAKLTVVNAGRSPARITQFIAAERVFSEFPKDPPYNIRSQPSWWEHSADILLPGETHARTVQFPFKNPDSKNFQLLLQHKDKLYVYGKVNYEDIRDTSKHFSHFCYFWTGEQQPPVFLNCGEYNDAD